MKSDKEKKTDFKFLHAETILLRPFLQSYKFTNKNYILSAWRDFKKYIYGVSTYDIFI